MSLVFNQEELKHQKEKLKGTVSCVTSLDGKIYHENKIGKLVNEFGGESNSSSYGVVVKDLQVGQIGPQLLLGSIDAATDLQLLSKYGITDLLTLTAKNENPRIDSIKQHFFPIRDVPEFPIQEFFEKCTSLLLVLIAEKKTVLVHCEAGKSRSATVIVAYLMKTEGWSVKSAIEFVKSKRPVIKPNEGFMKQLIKYEERLKFAGVIKMTPGRQININELRRQKEQLKETVSCVTSADGKVHLENKAGELQAEAIGGEPERKMFGFVVDDRPDLQVGEIGPYLLLGSIDAATDPQVLNKYGVTDLLILTSKNVNTLVDSVKQHPKPMLDVPEFPIQEFFDDCNSILSNLIAERKTVLVHCAAGVSRSATVIIAYLMKTEGRSLKSAIEFVKSKRPAIKPNEGFMKQLMNYEDQLKSAGVIEAE